MGYRAIQRAKAMNPNSILMMVSSGWCAGYLGLYDAAIADFERAYRINPLDLNLGHCRSGHSYMLLGLGQIELSMVMLEEALANAPEFGSTAQALIAACQMNGRHEDAQAMAEGLLKRRPTRQFPFTAPTRRSPTRRWRTDTPRHFWRRASPRKSAQQIVGGLAGGGAAGLRSQDRLRVALGRCQGRAQGSGGAGQKGCERLHGERCGRAGVGGESGYGLGSVGLGVALLNPLCPTQS